jgi:GT2 family glycosyltransferase
VEKLDELKRHAPEAIASWRTQPSFQISLLIDESSTPAQVSRTIRSLERQFYSHWSLVIVSRAGGLEVQSPRAAEPAAADRPRFETMRDAVQAATADYLVPIAAGDMLSEAALFRFAEAIQALDTVPVLYGDHDHLNRRGDRERPWFKPEWNEEMFLAQDYLSPAIAISSARAREVLNGTTGEIAAFELLLSAVDSRPGPVLHVPHILWHVDSSSSPDPGDARIHALATRLEPLGATVAKGPFATAKITWPLKDSPLVSIIIPTRDKVQLLRTCVETVLEHTHYRNLELVVVDNRSEKQSTKDYLSSIDRREHVRVLHYDLPYNFSAINNFAVEAALGEYFCFLNNDTEVIDGAWLEEMLRHATRPHVGAVGAKLLYPDMRIQHAGVAIGLGGAAGHSHRFTANGEPGYFAQAHVTHYVTAVTAACLVVERAKFEAVGGFDAEGLAIAYNDVDLCLKLQRAGWRNVYVPHAVLLHHESASRGNDMAPEHSARYFRELRILQDRWSTKTFQDPLHHPQLARESEQFRIAL